MSSALDQFERSLVDASRELHARRQQTVTHNGRTADERQPLRRRRRRPPFGQRRLLIPLVAFALLASGAAAGSSLLWPSQRLAEGRFNCFFATSGQTGHGPDVAGATANGQSPVSLCRMWYGLNAHTGLKATDVPFIACQENATTVSVYIATGRPDQCQQLGERPLPATYAAAAARLRNLQQALFALQNAHNCIAPATLARQARAVLVSHGFASWRLITPPSDPGKHWLFGYTLPADTGGTCGKLTGPVSTIDILTHRHVVVESVGPPRSIALQLAPILDKLGTITYAKCFTPTSVRTLVRQTFTRTPLRPRFATVAAQRGVTFSPPLQQRYDNGCVQIALAIPGNNNRFVDVLLNARGAPQLPAGSVYPPASSFHP